MLRPAAGLTAAAVAGLVLVPAASGASDAGINEVYGGGGNSGSTSDNHSALHTIQSGVIPARGHLLIRGAAGNNSLASFNVLNYFTSPDEDESGHRAYTDVAARTTWSTSAGTTTSAPQTTIR